MRPEDIKIGKYYIDEAGENIYYVRNIWFSKDPYRMSDQAQVSYYCTFYDSKQMHSNYKIALSWFAAKLSMVTFFAIWARTVSGVIKRRLNITSITRAPDNKSPLQVFLERAEQAVAELNKPELFESFELHRAWARGVDDYHQAMKSLIQKHMENENG